MYSTLLQGKHFWLLVPRGIKWSSRLATRHVFFFPIMGGKGFVNVVAGNWVREPREREEVSLRSNGFRVVSDEEVGIANFSLQV